MTDRAPTEREPRTPTYRCAACGETFEFGWSDEEAMAESRALWGDMRPDELAILCDDCFNGGMERMGRKVGSA